MARRRPRTVSAKPGSAQRVSLPDHHRAHVKGKVSPPCDETPKVLIPTPVVTGVMADSAPDEEEVYQRAVEAYRKTQDKEAQRANQTIRFESGLICLAFAADQHFGDSGTDYERCFAEAELIRNTPGMFAMTVGDVVNNFIIGQLRQARDQAVLSISDEWALTRRYLRTIGPKLLASISGNHDGWTTLLTGIDYFKDVVAVIRPNVIYDADDARILVGVGGAAYPGRIRHLWRGRSIYNPTHGIERTFKWDGDFIWAVGAHTHESGLIREFNAGGLTGVAAMCGSYKRSDAYARRLGFPKANRSTAVAIVFTEAGMLGFSNLHLAAAYMRRVYGGER